MQFLENLNPAFEQTTGVLLAQTRIPPLEEAIASMMSEESRIGLQAGAGGLSGMRSALAVFNSGNTRLHGETRKCYNCGEVSHLSKVCPRPPKERDGCMDVGSLEDVVVAEAAEEVEEEATGQI